MCKRTPEDVFKSIANERAMWFASLWEAKIQHRSIAMLNYCVHGVVALRNQDPQEWLENARENHGETPEEFDDLFFVMWGEWGFDQEDEV